MNKQRNKKGFTLIELIVVIAILGILALIAIPRFLGTLDNAKIKADNSTERIIQSAVQLYYAEEGTFPGTADTPFNVTALAPDYLNASELYWSNQTAITTITIDENGDITDTNSSKPTYP
ncbi:MAG: type II secretion system GspH family protein [Dethiosulfatibacter sp.]|nr:type II secretion system GspH family protein [Dethiosulfatibacter sp.]